ncbi:rod shape-determining protein MreC [Neiella sp. HB171785]|uniref:Cell shape-determining protein MreC n=1 Tax=Neiella litorisoli TaxID=2771431 RepID=A0A8J6QUI2_9GAMM|nr:rod shape-determining protein MreC [Neiella litorisoli]MBD1389872.1 rod shape-determining protein MreC [Neiella litorisoli]
MNPIFGRGPSLQLRLILAVITAILLAYLDRNFAYIAQVRGYLSTAVSPIYYVANLPEQVLTEVGDVLKTRYTLRKENAQLREQARLDAGKLQMLAQLKRENNRLRALLGSPVQQDARKMVTEVIAVESDPYRYRVLIDKGSKDGTYIGQPVLDDNGVVGQIDEVGYSTSRVLLIADLSHALPIRISRNDTRSIALGIGALDKMELQHVPHSADIREGDLAITSGLGGRFPEGYPVARVISANFDESLPFAEIVVQPIAALDRLRYLLLVWPAEHDQEPVTKADSAAEQVAEEGS